MGVGRGVPRRWGGPAARLECSGSRLAALRGGEAATLDATPAAGDHAQHCARQVRVLVCRHVMCVCVCVICVYVIMFVCVSVGVGVGVGKGMGVGVGLGESVHKLCSS